MTTDATGLPRHSRLAGLGLYLALIALPNATAVSLAMRLVGLARHHGPLSTVLGVAAFMTISVLLHLLVASRSSSWWTDYGASVCFDSTLSASEKLNRLSTDPQFFWYLASVLVAICALALATIALR